MELKDFEAKLQEMKTALEAKAKADAKIEVTEQLKAIEEASKEAKEKKETEIKEISDRLEVTIKAFDMLQTRIKSQTLGTPQQDTANAFSELGKKLSDKAKELEKFKQNKSGFGSIFLDADITSKAAMSNRMEVKVPGNLASATSLTGTYFVAPTVVPGVQLRQYEQVHMRDILPVGQTNSNIIRYVRDNGPTNAGAPGMIAEGGTKTQIDRSLQIYDAPVRKIGCYFRVPEEMIDDIPYLQSFLTQIGIQEVMLVEDTQILYGDGTGQNLSGLFTNATAFAAPIAGAANTTAPNNFDVLLAARTQGRVAKYNTNVALVSPIDYYKMIETKDTTNNYLFLGGGNGLDVAGTLNFRGIIRIVEHTTVAQGDFLVFDPSKAAIFDRMGTEVRFYDQDQDNAIKNLITIVIEKRLALPIYQPLAFIKGTFATAITDLTS